MSTPETALAIWTPEETDIIRSVIAPGLTDPELRLFANVCRATGLNPLMQQIHAIKRNAWNSQTRQSEPKLTIQTSIHGLRLIADRTRCYAPGRQPTFETAADGSLISATAYVKKLAGGVWHEVADTAYWDEYVQTSKEGKPLALWASKPHVMLAKCAEALALRRAFPAEMAGVYTDDEMPLVEAVPVPAPTAPVPSGQPDRTPRPDTIRTDERNAAELASAQAEFKAAMKREGMEPEQVVEIIQPVWPHITRAAHLGTLTAAQLRLATGVLKETHHVAQTATGWQIIAGPQPPAPLDLDDLPFDPPAPASTTEA